MTDNPERSVSAKRGLPLLKNEPRTLAELFLRSRSEYDLPNALNFKKDGEWHAISASTMVERAENIALGLYSLGLRKGDRAAILAANSPEWTLTDAGCQFAGIVDVPIYTTASPHSIKYILVDSSSRVLFIQDKAAFDRIESVLAECSSIEALIFFDPDGVADPRLTALSDLESRGAELRESQSGLAEAA